jgi:chromosome segregation ATPase
MLTKQERKTQKKVLVQRDAARSEAEQLRAEVERLKGDVRVLAAEEIRKVEREAEAKVHEAEKALSFAKRELDALMKDFDSAIRTKMEETQKELADTQARLQSAQREVMKLVTRNSAQAEEIENNRTTIEGFKATVAKLDAELSTLKMEDTKTLRKRLHAKTERVQELEREVAQLKAAPRPVVAPTEMQRLSAMLSKQLRARVGADAPSAQVEEHPVEDHTVPAPAPAP